MTQKWAKSPEETQKSKYDFYVIVIFSLATLASVFVICRVIILLLMSLRSARIAHDHILKLVLQGPINLFFDVTPIGKILNRFSKDLAVLDNNLCFNVGSFFSCFYQALASLIVCAVSCHWIIVAEVIMIVAGFILFKFTLKGYKETNRIESVTKSPLLSFLQETQTGGSVIRAFKREADFRLVNYELINKNTLANQMSTGVWTWYSIRMDLFCSFVLTVATAFSVT